MGRKSAYKKEYNQLAENYALLGATDKEMADLFGVTERTLNQWKKDYPEFLQSLKKRKKISIITELSLYFSRCSPERAYTHLRQI